MGDDHLQSQPEADQCKPAGDAEETKSPEDSEGVARLEIKKIEDDQRDKRMEYLESLESGLGKQVEEWKKSYPRIESVHVLDQLYIYRSLRRDEYLSIMGPGLPREKSDQSISDKCVLWPKRSSDWLQMSAGLPFTLSEAILRASGFEQSDPITVRL